MSVTKLRAGMSYLAKKSGYWWIIQQEGQRSWNAVQFTHIVAYEQVNARIKHGNASIMLQQFAGCEMYAYTNANHHMRRAMFNALKYGTVEEPYKDGM